MYKCEAHGEQAGDWCPACNKPLECDCSTIETARFKDLQFYCSDGPRNVTIYVQHCGTCGDVKGVGTWRVKND